MASLVEHWHNHRVAWILKSNLSLDPSTSHGLDLDLPELLASAEASTLSAHGQTVTWSRKVFIPLTRLCRDVCHYCTFATTPRGAGPSYLSREEVLAIARAGAAAGCREAL